MRLYLENFYTYRRHSLLFLKLSFYFSFYSNFHYKFFRKFVNLLTIISFLFSQLIASAAYAANQTDIPYLVPDGSTNTSTDRAPNGTPIVNIAAPNQAGVSLNNWNGYNVTDENQILNNAKGATVDTNLAGQIYGNPNFNPDGVNPAAIIINQDLSHNRSSINGAIEVSGPTKAELIFANGSGFDISGAVFINTSQITIVTGTPNLNAQTGNLENITISNQADANVIITGINIPGYVNLGINASEVDSINIVSRAIQVMGDIHTKGILNLKLGNGAYDYRTKNISSDAALGATTKPVFALDSSYLGGMYAGSIRIITTEDGVGVRSRGDLVSAANIDLNSVGNIEYERADSKTNLNVESVNGAIIFGKYSTSDRAAITKAMGDVTLTGKSGVELNDSSLASNFYAEGSIYLNSAEGLVKNNSTIKADAVSQADGGLFVDAASFENTSLVFSAGNLSIATNGLAKNTSGSIEASKAITVNAGSFVNAALLKAAEAATLTSAGNFVDTNQIKATGSLSITANGGISYNDLYSGAALSLTNSGSGDIIQNYKSYSLGTTSITNNGGNIIFGLTNNSNSGSLYSQGNLTITSAFDITNNSNIFGDSNLVFNATNLTNNMRLIAGKITGSDIANLTINLDSNLLNKGSFFAATNINLNVDGIVTNDGNGNQEAEIFALKGDININGKDGGGSKANSVINLSALITASLGDINIHSYIFKNSRNQVKTQYITGGLGEEDYYEHDVTRSGLITAWFDGVMSPKEAKISSGKNIDITTKGSQLLGHSLNNSNAEDDVPDLLNEASTMTAAGKITLTADLFDNRAFNFESYTQSITNCWSKGRDACYLDLVNSEKHNYIPDPYPSLIGSGDDTKIIATRDISSGTSKKKDPLFKDAANAPRQSGANPNSPTSDTWQITIPSGNSGLTEKASPDSEYLFKSVFDTDSALIASRYYKIRFGFNPSPEQNPTKWLGDAFYEWNAINEQINFITKKSQDWNAWARSNGLADGSDWQANINKLIDNAYEQHADLELVPGVKLTTAQIVALRKDIIWYEEETVKLADGSAQRVLTPRVYLADASKIDLGNYSGIIAKNITLNAGGNLFLANTKLISKEQTNLNAVENVSIANDMEFVASANRNNQGGQFNQGAQGTKANHNTQLSIGVLGLKDDAETARNAITFNAGTDLQINSGGSIDIANNYFQSGGSIFMTATGDINNSNFTVKADQNVMMNATNINNIHTIPGMTNASGQVSTSSNETRIEAGNIVSLNAIKDADGNGGNITNIGATIKAGNLLYMTAENDITNKALVDYKINGSSTNADGSAITQDQALASNANRITSTLISQGSLESNGNLVIIANNDFNNIGSNITATTNAYIEATNGDVNITTAVLRDRAVTSWGSKKKGGTKTTDITTNIQSEITSANNLTIISGNNIELQSAKITADNDINITAENNLLLTTAQDSSFVLQKTHNKRTFSFTNGEMGRINSTVINNEISSSNNGTINLNSGNLTYAQFKEGSREYTDPKLAYLNNLDANNTLYDPAKEIHKNWDTTLRGLTGAGTAVVAIAAVALVVATGGAAAAGASLAVSAGATAGGIAATGAGVVTAAAASTAAATAATSATNASMNDSGNFFGSLGHVGHVALKDTTSKESLKNIAIASAAAALTFGIAQGVSSLSTTTTASASTASSTTNLTASNINNTSLTLNNSSSLVSNSSSVVNGSSIASSTVSNSANIMNTASAVNTINTSATLTQRFTTALTQTGIQGISQAAAQSAINGDSFSDSLKLQIKNVLINSAGQVVANEIGMLAHGQTDSNGHVNDSAGNAVTYFNNNVTQISTAQQLALHAALGCGMAAAGGNNCGVGAAAGVVGEAVGSSLRSSVIDGTISRESAITTAQLAGTLSSAVVVDPDDGNSVFAGSNIAYNAAANNALNPWGITDSPYDKKLEEKTEQLNTYTDKIEKDMIKLDKAATTINNAYRLEYQIEQESPKFISPMQANRDIELARGSPQTIYQRYQAVYKSGNEPKGIVSPQNLNIGLANFADPSKGQIEGQPVNFGNGLEGVSNYIFSLHEGTLFSHSVNFILPAGNDMSLTHDNWAQNVQFIRNNSWANPSTIAPAYIYNTYGLIGKPINLVTDYINNNFINNNDKIISESKK